MDDPADELEKDYLLIVGMHRSGTSMLAHLMVKLGYCVGRTPVKPALDNPEGFFENDAIKCFHDKLLRRIGSSWSDTRSIEPRLLDVAMARGAFSEFEFVLEKEFEGYGKRLVKDPRMCRLMPFWNKALEKLELNSVRCLLPIRHPMNVARSLQKRNGFPISHGLLLWIQSVLAAERDTRRHKRMIMIYDDLLVANGAPALASFLGVAESMVNESIHRVANPMLRHQSGGETSDVPAIESLATQIWEALSASAYQNSGNESAFDRLWRDYEGFSNELETMSKT